jgi:hypothetical protein
LGKKVVAGVAGGLGIAAVAMVASGLIPLDSVSADCHGYRLGT